jgi:hypothetical protein
MIQLIIRGIRPILVATLTGLVLMGLAANSYAQEKPGVPAGPSVQQSTQTQQQPLNPRRMWFGLKVVADLGVTPATYSGPCPARFVFTGQIYANKATPVEYKILRSDNVQTTPKTLTFEGEGRQEITYTWEIGDANSLPAFDGWVLVEAVYPINRKTRSNPVLIRGTCTDQANVPPQPAGGQQAESQGQPAK